MNENGTILLPEEALSPERIERLITEWCEKNGCELVKRGENEKLRECIKQFIANWDLWGASIHGRADHSDKQLTDLTNEILDVARDLVGAP